MFKFCTFHSALVIAHSSLHHLQLTGTCDIALCTLQFALWSFCTLHSVLHWLTRFTEPSVSYPSWVCCVSMLNWFSYNHECSLLSRCFTTCRTISFLLILQDISCWASLQHSSNHLCGIRNWQSRFVTCTSKIDSVLTSAGTLIICMIVVFCQTGQQLSRRKDFDQSRVLQQQADTFQW